MIKRLRMAEIRLSGVWSSFLSGVGPSFCPNSYLGAWLLAIAISAGFNPTARADEQQKNPDDQLRHVEEQRSQHHRMAAEWDRQTQSLAREKKKLTALLTEKAQEISHHERLLTAIERRLADLRQDMARQYRRYEKASEHHRAALSMLPILIRQPPLSVLLYSPSAHHGRRHIRMISSLLTTARLTLDQQEHQWLSLRQLHQENTKTHANLAQTTRQWEQRREEMITMLEQHRHNQADFKQRAGKARQQAQRLEQRAHDLRTLIEKLAADRASSSDHGSTSTLEGLTIPAHLPAVGMTSIIDSGKGNVIRILPRSQAQVVAPADGRVVYAGPFRSYGIIIIIDHGKGDHSVLTGLDRTFVLADQHVIMAEPLGEMSSEDGTSLHWEVRRSGALIDPAPWLSIVENKG